MKKVLTWLLIIVGSAAFAYGASLVPNMISQHKINQNKMVRGYTPKMYQGWVLAYSALNEAEVTMYNTAPEFETPEEAEAFKTLNYPEKFLPDLINEFGILIQKPYAGEYTLNRQKSELVSYFTKESDKVNEAINSYIVTDSKNPNAYDAVVVKALNSFSDTLGTLNRATSELTLESISERSLGDYYGTFIPTEDMSAPLAYSSIAKEYLMANIKRHNSQYTKDLNGDTSKLDSATIREVNLLLPQILE